MEIFRSPITPSKIIKPERDQVNAQLGSVLINPTNFINIQPIVLEILRGQAKTGQTTGCHSQKQYISPVYWGRHN